MAAEVSYNNAWYTFGGGLARKNVVSKSYSPFGELLTEQTSGFGYNGEYYNAATGMIYLRARFYEPEMNRFGQKDILRGSITDGISLNRYLYCQSDPVNYCDPSGMIISSRMSVMSDGGGSGRDNSMYARTTASSATASNQPPTFQEYLAQNKYDPFNPNSLLPATGSNTASERQSQGAQGSSAQDSGITRESPSVQDVTGNRGYSCERATTENKLHGTIAVGGELTAAFGLRGSVGTQLALDSNGHIGILFYVGGGGGFPAAASTITVTYTSAESINDLRGWGAVGGGSLGVVGAEVTVGSNYGGFTVSIGPSTPLPEAHGEVTFTWVVDITEQLKRTGKYDIVYSGITEAYEGAVI